MPLSGKSLALMFAIKKLFSSDLTERLNAINYLVNHVEVKEETKKKLAMIEAKLLFFKHKFNRIVDEMLMDNVFETPEEFKEYFEVEIKLYEVVSTVLDKLGEELPVAVVRDIGVEEH